MSRLLPIRRLCALALLLSALAAVGLLPTAARQSAARPAGPDYLLFSPNTSENLNLEAARQQLASPEHGRFRRLAGGILDELGVRGHQTHDALGEWRDGVENSLFVELPAGTDPATLHFAAATFGLAARQKAVLAFHADPAGDDLLAVIDLRERSLAGVRALLDGYGFPDRTLLPHRGGWRVVLVAPRDRRAELESIPAVSYRLEAGRAVLLGELTRDGASERYRELIRANRAVRHVPAPSRRCR
jgi:hypothetical protein